jgi:ABC-type branched-subunit amino acid transport system substrate-binding protein
VPTFDRLSDVVQYAQNLSEYPPYDLSSQGYPLFNSFNKSHKNTYLNQLLTFFGFKKDIDIEQFSKKLHRLVNQRELDGYFDDFVQKFFTNDQIDWYLLGPLYGAFHSLVRVLQELESKKIIDNNLKIINPMNNFVFSGNVTSYSPYGIETLYLLITLLERNPDQVFLLRDKGASPFRMDNIKDELQERFNVSSASIEKNIERFLNTLPLAIYIVSSEEDILRISDSSEYSLLQEEQWAYFFEDKMNESFKIKDIEPSSKKIALKTFIELYTVSKSTDQLNRLHYTKRDEKNSWDLFSSPVEYFKNTFNFHYDSFVVLTTGKYFMNWQVSLFAQNINTMDGFRKIRMFNVSSGQEVYSFNQNERIEYFKEQIQLAQEVEQAYRKQCNIAETASMELVSAKKDSERSEKQENVLPIGTSTDFSRSLKGWSKLLQKGLGLAIDNVNSNGGIDGTQIQLIFLNDAYDPKLTRINIETFLNDFHADMTLGSNGTANLEAYLDLIKEKKVLAIFPNTGAFRDPNLTYVLHFGPSYQDEGYAVTKYALGRSNYERFAFFYQNDGYGLELLAGAKDALKGIADKEVIEISYDPMTADVSEQIRQIREFKPDVIAFFSLPTVTQNVIRQLGAEFLHNKLFVGNNRLGDRGFANFLQEQALTVIIPQLVPNPKTSDTALAQEFREIARAEKVPIDAISLMGYLQALLFLDILKNIKRPFTKERFVTAFESIHDYTFKGLKFSFDPKKRQLSHVIWIDAGDDNWIEQKIDTASKLESTER